MAITAGIGTSKNKDSSQAGYEAATMALRACGEGKAKFVVTFASSSFDQNELIKGINEATGGVQLVGCSTAGEITNEGSTTGSVAVMAIGSETITFYTGLGKDVKKGAREAGQAVAKEVEEKAKKAGDSLEVFVMFPDVLTGNGADSVRGVLDILGAHFPVVGGAPGDDFLFKQTFEYKDNEVVSGAIGGLGLSGKFSVGIGVHHGWVPIGLPMKVTKSEGAVLHELDGKPAINIYEDYFGEKAAELRKEPLARMAITYPIGLKIPEYADEYLIRDPITVDEKGAITCAAEIPEGSEVRLMIGSKEKAIDAAKEAAQHVINELQGQKPKFVLMFNCIAREKLYGQSASEEIKAVLDIIGHDTPLLGFYTYGEQAPLGGEFKNREKCNTRFYNETMVLFGVGE
ncbi:MAG: hypothetical protein G01um101448_779 [Parcubacteria group bacterium Gr01-1014_48]|nr:MAG: hypothetical protein Greene041614_592 [Parcubacteria group bacterium Greene0416_14]TSC73427.1 MAG: hypothetical protein G01um101448_779 [Parcubacteria group bacterium Gr01-1014_48]TSD00840.1 MAG: hypothetical protein Greene101415_641 [Parcubacteria group bacterium Greene1014_15]TSD07922.1 MAG: hypothetical protein Greene07144_552 [Parcubacteria group bacterium Greene0714_4]